MIAAPILNTSFNLLEWISHRCLLTIRFPDFSYIKEVFGLANSAALHKTWDAKPEIFLDQLLLGKLAPVSVERYLKTKSQGQIESLLKQSIELIALRSDQFNLENILNASRLIRLDNKVDDYVKNILKVQKGYPPEEGHTIKAKPRASRTKVFYSFFPNLADTFLKAFNILDAGKKPESIWDYSALITIYLSALSLPVALFGLAFHITSTPYYALAISAAITIAFLASLYIYLRWLRPLPHDLPNCKNIQDIETPFFADRREIIDEIIQAIEVGQNVLIVGETGRGKSAIAREIGKRLKNKSMQVVNNCVFENGYLSPVSKLEMDFAEAEKYPGQVTFFIDEFDKVVAQENLVKFLQEQMDLKQFQIIAACERTNYEEKIKSLPQLDGRFPKKVFLLPPIENELIEILLSYYNAKGGDIDCRESPAQIVKHIIAETNKHIEEMRCREQPAASIRVWEYALKKMHGMDFRKYKSETNLMLMREIRDIQNRFRWMDYNEKMSALSEIEKKQEAQLEEERKDSLVRERMLKIKKLSALRVNCRKVFEKETREFKQGDLHLIRRWEYMKLVEEKLKVELIEEENLLPNGIKLRLDRDYIDKIIREYTPPAGQESAKPS